MGTKLEQLTLKYWEVSSIYHGRLSRPMNTGQALTFLRKASREVGPKRLLRRKLLTIKDSIISGGNEASQSQKQG